MTRIIIHSPKLLECYSLRILSIIGGYEPQILPFIILLATRQCPICRYEIQACLQTPLTSSVIISITSLPWYFQTWASRGYVCHRPCSRSVLDYGVEKRKKDRHCPLTTQSRRRCNNVPALKSPVYDGTEAGRLQPCSKCLCYLESAPSIFSE